MRRQSCSVERGQAAFYGPKIDFVVDDVQGRPWQLGTIQLDYNLPERFDLGYVGSDGRGHRPVMIHRAPLGSLERFVGLLIEHFDGAFPLWLAPSQVLVAAVSDRSREYANVVVERLRSSGLRVELADSGRRLGACVRDATERRVPYLVAVGPREQARNQVSVRVLGDAAPRPLSLDEFVAVCQQQVATRALRSPLLCA